jgi:transketolase
MKRTPGIDMTAGSLGHGLSAGLGMALAARLQGRDYHVWVVIGDGECQEGSIWEAAMSAAKWKVDNLTAILDRNRLQNDDCVQDIMPIEPLVTKWQAFGWRVVEIDGHDMAQIVEALESVEHLGQPTLILAHTVKGKGVSFMEGVAQWHGRAPCAQEAAQALDEIRRCACE